MPLLVVGINHRTAPLEVRERVVFDAARLPVALADLKGSQPVREAVIVSTCNRTELYAHVEQPVALGRWLESYHGVGQNLGDCLYELTDADAVAHAFAVAAGLDSMVIGEPQILGQLKDAYRWALDAGAAGPMLNRLYQAT